MFERKMLSKINILIIFLSQTGKTRTKEKYRVVYTDHQRLELEKEFHCNRYITIRRKSELAANLGLSERQVHRLSPILTHPPDTVAVGGLKQHSCSVRKVVPRQPGQFASVLVTENTLHSHKLISKLIGQKPPIKGN